MANQEFVNYNEVPARQGRPSGQGYQGGHEVDYSYEKFVFQNASAFDVLKKIQEETKAHIYLTTDNVLHVEPQYIEIPRKL